MSRAALTLCLWWLALVALTQGATASHQSRRSPPPPPPPPSPPAPWHRQYWLEGVKCRGGTVLKTLFDGEDLYQSRDDAKDACAVGCLATSGCAYADLLNSRKYSEYAEYNSVNTLNTICSLRTDATCGDYASNTNSFYSLFVVPRPPSPPHPPPSPPHPCKVHAALSAVSRTFLSYSSVIQCVIFFFCGSSLRY